MYDNPEFPCSECGSPTHCEDYDADLYADLDAGEVEELKITARLEWQNGKEISHVFYDHNDKPYTINVTLGTCGDCGSDYSRDEDGNILN